VDSFLNKRESLLLRIQAANPDIIAITEVKPKNYRYPLQRQEIQLEGYNCWPNIESPGRGVVLYTKSKIKASEKVIMAGNFQDSVWCSIKLDNNDKLLIGCVYRSPNSSNENNIKLKESLLSALKSPETHIVVMGDFNFPEIDWESESSRTPDHRPSSEFVETIRETYLHQHVRFPTHYRGTQTLNILDLVLSNEENIMDDMRRTEPMGSSHHVTIQFNILCYGTSTDNVKAKRLK
jgi:exonuclease III